MQDHQGRFKINAPTWHDGLKLPIGFYSIAYIQDHFEHIVKKNMKP